MRAVVGEIERQRGLRIGPPLRADAGRRAAERFLAVSPDRKFYPDLTAGVFDGDPSRFARDRKCRHRDPRQFKFGSAGFERHHEMLVLDIVAEYFEPDLGGVEKNFRRAHEPLRVVDDTKFLQWRGMGQARLPYTKRFERRNRAGKKRRGAVIRPGRRRDQERVHAGGRERNRADKPGRTAANDRHFGGQRFFWTVHVLNQFLRR